MKRFSFLLAALFLTSLGLREAQALTPAEKARINQYFDQQIAIAEQGRASNPTGTQIAVDAIEQMRADALAGRVPGGGVPGAKPNTVPRPTKPAKLAAQIRPDPKNPWSIPGAMWTQKEDGSYEYYRLVREGKKNIPVPIVPHVKPDGSVTWTDKKK